MSDNPSGMVEELRGKDGGGHTEEFGLESIRESLGETIDRSFDQQRTLIEALPAMGKSYGVIKWAAETGKPLTVLTSRHELYDQYIEWAEERNLSYRELPGFHNDCPTMGTGSEIANRANEIYKTGITGKELHDRSEYYFGEPLPCQEDGVCPYIERREFDPAEYDVLIGHYRQAHNPTYIEDRYVAVDEFPEDDYLFTPTHNEVAEAVSNYLEVDDTLPFESWKDLTYNRREHSVQGAIEEWRESLGMYGEREAGISFQHSPGFDARAPLMIDAALQFERLENDWEYADLDHGRIAVRSQEDSWAFLLPPPFHYAESVIGLDGTPTVGMWRLILGGRFIEHEKILESDWEKRKYLREVLNLEIIQTEAGTKPYYSGTNVNVRSDGALLEAIHEREGEQTNLITSKAAEELYEQEGVSRHIEEAEHYGNLKGSNQFARERLGAVIGCPHPDESRTIERWAALNEEAAGRVEDDDGSHKGSGLDFGSGFGNALYHNFVHNEVLQAVMRFGREERDEGRGARVYVHTSCLPPWVRPDYSISVETWSDGMHDVVQTLRGLDEWPDAEVTNSEIVEHTEIKTAQVRELMKELDDQGYVTHRRGGRGNAYHWSDVRLSAFTRYGHVSA